MIKIKEICVVRLLGECPPRSVMAALDDFEAESVLERNQEDDCRPDGFKNDLKGNAHPQLLVDAALRVVVREGLEEGMREESHTDDAEGRGGGANTHF